MIMYRAGFRGQNKIGRIFGRGAAKGRAVRPKVLNLFGAESYLDEKWRIPDGTADVKT